MTPEAKLRRLNERAVVLAAAMHDFGEATPDYDRLLQVIARRTAEILKNTCTVQLLSDDATMLAPIAIHATDPEVIERVRALLAAAPIKVADHALYLGVLDTGTSLLVPHIDESEHRKQASAPHAEISSSLGMHSGLIVALRIQGRSVGALSLGRYDPALPPFDDADRELAESLAVHASLAISNSRLLRSLRHELAERVRAEDALRRAEQQLQHAQKMEAVGRLAGGIAHDFNNVLSVILSYAEIVEQELPATDPLRADAAEIRQAGERAASLTRQLLAFSRQQVLEPRILDLNQSVGEMERLLKRLLGEDVELTLMLARRLWSVLADPGQIEQVVMNLAVNARDAMPRGGKLTIQTDNVELDDEYANAHHGVQAGPHVMIAVSDTGVGMDKATQTRIFEPFFTTKQKGKGTGLGLAMVFGIVKQSGGHIWVYSEPSEGTTFRIYLPRADAAGETPRAEEPTTPLPGPGTETILLVEDDDQVRTLACTILRHNGYVVLEASNGGEALLICDQHRATIHLLVTDVVLPRMSGRELVERLLPMRPEMRVLYMSGYTDEAVLQHGVLESSVFYLQKPFTPGSLVRKVGAVLR